MSASGNVRELILGIVRSIVDTPDAVMVDASNEGEGVRFDVRLAEGEIGSVIGPQGRTARSIRIVLSAASMKHGRRMAVNFVEPHSETRSAAGIKCGIECQCLPKVIYPDALEREDL
ncbi:hypothetical protein HDF16_004788 [Granulicella aggregans]|uniref:RNA-binding protein KhpA n=1 Tax=Granulicella aggregans TaxID=474949 RepID=A0A7W7ZHM1_9BACT|nr:hypothetical protein [Granulicella aggregans]